MGTKQTVICLVGIFLVINSSGSAAKMTNLTAITWAHAVNSQTLLSQTLSGDKEMIEADVVLGKLATDPTNPTDIPIMAHPPENRSDLSLQKFLAEILAYNSNPSHVNNKRGIKLDFKSIEAYQAAVPILGQHWENITSTQSPLWLNADILAGPVNNTETTPVDANRFIDASKNFFNSTLSLGWTTNWGPESRNGSYTPLQVQEMINVTRSQNVTSANHSLTFPVRAGIAANSLKELEVLFDTLKTDNHVTFTIWSSENDYVNVESLREFILKFGVDKVYVDVPEQLYNQLNLPSGASSIGGSMSRLLNIALLGFVTLFSVRSFF